MKSVGFRMVMLLLLAPSPLCAKDSTRDASTSGSKEGKVILEIKTRNPADHAQTVSIKCYLPAGTTTNDVLDLCGLELGYDVNRAGYYVYRELELPSNAEQTFDVPIRDVWIVPETVLDSLLRHAEALGKELEASKFRGNASRLSGAVRNNIGIIVRKQTENTAVRMGVEQHIAAFKAELQLLREVKKDICDLENLAMRIGKDPQQLLGEPGNLKPATRVLSNQEECRKAVIKITITNPSPKESRKISVKHRLPWEVLPSDIIDTDGLQIRTDGEKGGCYLHGEIELAPHQATNFNIVVRDKWNVNDARIHNLSLSATSALAQVRLWRRYPSVEKALEAIHNRLAFIAHTRAPKILNEDYVAYYRGQADELDTLEMRIDRIRIARFLEGKIGTDEIPPPTPKTTWRIIYIILIFLAAVSLLVLLCSAQKSRHPTLDAGLR